MEKQSVLKVKKSRKKKRPQGLKNSAMIVLAALLGAYSSKALEILEKQVPYPLSWAALFSVSLFMIFIVYFIWYDFVN
jgi:hypothetical protein